MNYPKRLIEVDLPIKRISEHSRREKSIRHGHISTLHIWWARRPLAACRAVLCASLWPDPADSLCPKEFIDTAREEMLKWADNDHLALLGEESVRHFIQVNNDPGKVNNHVFLRQLLLDFIADFANWDNSTKQEYLDTARNLTQAAHEALGGDPGTRPLVVDPFAGGGSIPLEALRVGADTFASDLNPIPVLLNKVELEYIPKYGNKLAEEVRKWGEWIKDEAEKQLKQYYPDDEDGSTPIAYIWARTIQCEGPGCGTEVPLMRGMWLARKKGRNVALRMKPDRVNKRVNFEIVENLPASEVQNGTVQRGNATCPVCGYTTPVASVRRQMKEKHGGADTARLVCVVTTHARTSGRTYRLPEEKDLIVIKKVKNVLCKKIEKDDEITPNEPLPVNPGEIDTTLGFRVQSYGINTWKDLFTSRQLLALTTLVDLVKQAGEQLRQQHDKELAAAVQTCLAFVVDRMADGNSSLARWQPTGEKISNTFGRQALPMVWDFCEANPFCEATRSLQSMINWVAEFIEKNSSIIMNGSSLSANAAVHPLPDDSVRVFFTDPPYYDAVPYADLSDFFYVWLKRTLRKVHPDIFVQELVNKEDECIVDEIKGKDREYFEAQMHKAMAEGRRITQPSGIGIVVFAHKTTAGWEAQLQSMLEAGWVFTASWPIDTEMSSRLRAMNSAALASSVHLVCRPRAHPDGSLREDSIGDWREVQAELPRRIHEWMPRLAREGVVGADAIFACLGPALEIFSRYSKVVQPGSEREIPLREYLEKVWAAVSQEALNMVFEGGDTTGFEEDARVTAMWLWTLGAGGNGNGVDDSENKTVTSAGYMLEYDTARKIAQGLGAHLETMPSLVEIKGETARLLPVHERVQFLFETDQESSGYRRGKRKPQLSLFEQLGIEEDSDSGGQIGLNMIVTGRTVLDRLHQAMLLFATGRTEALKRFLAEDGVGMDGRFWKLAQALNALYPKNTDERRWVEAVQTYKKSLGF